VTPGGEQVYARYGGGSDRKHLNADLAGQQVEVAPIRGDHGGAVAAQAYAARRA